MILKNVRYSILIIMILMNLSHTALTNVFIRIIVKSAEYLF